MSDRPPLPKDWWPPAKPPRRAAAAGSRAPQLCYGCAAAAFAAILSSWGGVRWNSVPLAISGITFAILALVGEVRLWRAKQRGDAP